MTIGWAAIVSLSLHSSEVVELTKWPPRHIPVAAMDCELSVHTSCVRAGPLTCDPTVAVGQGGQQVNGKSSILVVGGKLFLDL